MARILVIDDEEVVRRPISDLLRMDGHDVEEAGDGQAGLELYRKAPADVVITDIFMPEKDGLELIQELKKMYPDVKIIAISGVGIRQELDIVSLTKQLGALYAFEKPFDMHELINAVNELLAENG